jgi:ribosomal protein S30
MKETETPAVHHCDDGSTGRPARRLTLTLPFVLSYFLRPVPYLPSRIIGTGWERATRHEIGRGRSRTPSLHTKDQPDRTPRLSRRHSVDTFDTPDCDPTCDAAVTGNGCPIEIGSPALGSGNRGRQRCSPRQCPRLPARYRQDPPASPDQASPP